MRKRHIASVEPQNDRDWLSIAGAALACFACGFVGVMIIPHYWPRYVQTPITNAPNAVWPAMPSPSVASSPATHASRSPSSARIVQDIQRSAVPAPTRVGVQSD